MPQKNETAPEPIDIYLDVEHVWQQDPEHDIPVEQRRTICAIACMKMVVDYVLPEQAAQISLRQMYQDMKAAGGQNSNMNWKHASEAAFFKNLGLKSWRRDWLTPNPDPKKLGEIDGYNNQQLIAVSDQMINEKGAGGYKLQALKSIQASLKAGMPFIASVAPNFSENQQDHQIVINGFGNDGKEQWIYFVDPVLDSDKHQDRQKVSVEYFLKYFNSKGIFVEKQ